MSAGPRLRGQPPLGEGHFGVCKHTDKPQFVVLCPCIFVGDVAPYGLVRCRVAHGSRGAGKRPPRNGDRPFCEGLIIPRVRFKFF